MVKIIATFTGQNGSLGYEKEKEYKLLVHDAVIQREAGDGICGYDSLENFLENWTNIQVIKK